MDYNLTKKDVEKLLDKSGKTITRYIKAGKLHPIKKKRNGHLMYLFSLEDVEDFIKGQGGHTGQTVSGQGTKGGTNDNTPTPDNDGRVKNLNEETGGTNKGTDGDKKDTPEDTGDRTKDTKTFALLEKTLGMLQTTLDNQSKQIENQSRQIDNLTNTQQFLINENSGFRKMLGLPTAREDIINGSKEGEVVDTEEGTRDKTQKTGETKPKRQPSKKPKAKTKTTKGHKGQKQKTKPITSNKKGSKKNTNEKEKPIEVKKRGFLSWIFK